MKPESLNILGIQYKILYFDKIQDVDIHESELLCGQCDYRHHTIRVYNCESINCVWETIWHEVLHAISDRLHFENIGDADKKKHDELDILSMALTDILFRNNLLKLGE